MEEKKSEVETLKADHTMLLADKNARLQEVTELQVSAIWLSLSQSISVS